MSEESIRRREIEAGRLKIQEKNREDLQTEVLGVKETSLKRYLLIFFTFTELF